MDINFIDVAASATEPVIFEKILGEKPGGGIIANPAFDIPTGSVVGLDGAVLKHVKAFRLLKAVAVIDTEIDIAKGSGIVSGDVIGVGALGVASTALDQTNATKDVVTVTLGVVVPIGTVLYEAAGVSANTAVPHLTPLYLTGAKVIAGAGDQLIKLVNIAVVRKETVNASVEMLALMPTIKAV